MKQRSALVCKGIMESSDKSSTPSEYNADAHDGFLADESGEYCFAHILAKAQKWKETGAPTGTVIEALARAAGDFIYFYRLSLHAVILAESFQRTTESFFREIITPLETDGGALRPPFNSEPWRTLAGQPVRFKMANKLNEEWRTGLFQEGSALRKQGRNEVHIVSGFKKAIIRLTFADEYVDRYAVSEWVAHYASQVHDKVKAAIEEERTMTDEEVIAKFRKEAEELFDYE